MSFIHSYHRLFKVTIRDDDSGEELKTFRFQPTSHSLEQLDNHRLVYRSRDEGFEVFYRADPLAAEQVTSPITDRIRLSFGLIRMDADFFSRYKPSLTRKSGPQLYFDNLTPTGQLQNRAALSTDNIAKISDAIKIYPKVFGAKLDLTGGGPAVTKFIIKDKFDPAVTILEVPVTVNPGAKLASTKIDLAAKPEGPYLIKTDAAGSAARNIYIGNELARTRISMLVDIHWESPQDSVSPGGEAYEIRFKKI